MSHRQHCEAPTAVSHSELCLERLEQRCLLADFASVGLMYHLDSAGRLFAETFATEGTITVPAAAPHGIATGQTFVSEHAVRVPDGVLPYNRVVDLPDGRFLRVPDRGRLASPQSTNGAQFLTQFGNPGIGWWHADRRLTGPGGAEIREEIEYIVERPAAADLSNLQGTWRFSLIGVDFVGDEPFNGTGVMTIQGSTITWTVEFGSVARATSIIETVGPQGRFISSEQEFFYLSVDGNELVFADMADRDGIIFAGVAVRSDASVTVEDLAGGYLLTWAAAGQPAIDIRNNDIAFAQRHLELRPNGQYEFFDLRDFTLGLRDPISRGTWTISGSRLVLAVQGTDELLNFTIADNGRVLLGTDWDDSQFADAVLGLAIRIGGPELVDPLIVLPGVTPQGIDAVYQLHGEQWFISRVAQAAGAPPIAGDLVTWIDPRTELPFAAGTTAEGDLLLFAQNERGRWTFRNLNVEHNRPENITGDISVMIAPGDRVNLVGITDTGDVVRFFQTGPTRPITEGGGLAWGFMNISQQQLAPAGVATPQFAGPIESYATPWGGLNVVGLDAAGRIQSVWWAPGLDRWQATDLTERYNAPILAGGLTVFLTPWDAINIVGVDPQGNLRATWWLPTFGDHWENNNLTAEINGPLLRPDQLAAFVSRWGGLNIAGIESTTGQVVTYWWSPERTALGWAASNLHAITEGAPATLRGPLQGLAAADDSLNIFAFNEQDELVRLFWRPPFGGMWAFEPVHAAAQEFA